MLCDLVPVLQPKHALRQPADAAIRWQNARALLGVFFF